jgi:hypothetical protein
MDKKEKEEIIKELTIKFKKLPKEETKKMWAEFGRHLTKEGVNDGTDVIVADELPGLQYIGEKGLALVALGKKFGSKAVYMVKKWLKNQWVTILILLFTTAGPNQILNNIGAWRNAGYDVACEAIESFQNKSYKPFFETPPREGTGVVFNPDWRANKNLFSRERTAVNSTYYLSNPASGTTVMSTSNVSPAVTASLDWSVTSLSS